MVQGNFDRVEVYTRRVEYRIKTPHGEPVEGQTLGVVLANVHRELGGRVQNNDAYRVRGEDGQIVIEFDTEFEDGPFLVNGDEVVVQVGGSAISRRMGRVVLNHRDNEHGLEVFVPND